MDEYLENIVNLPKDVGERIKKDLPEYSFGKNLFIDTIPLTKDSCVAIFEAPGGRYNPLAECNRRTLILQSRSLTSAEARNMLWSVFRRLSKMEDNLLELSNGKHPCSFVDTPHKVGKDEKGRITFQFSMFILYHN